MEADYLVISTSLNPASNSKVLAWKVFEWLGRKGKAEFIDLSDCQLPICGGSSARDHAEVTTIAKKIHDASAIVLATPVYNFSASASAKNLIELTGKAWEGKVVGFVCAAGGKTSYMAIMGLANSLMLDFRCLIIPRFIYADSSAFDGGKLTDPDVERRIRQLSDEVVRVAARAKVP